MSTLGPLEVTLLRLGDVVVDLPYPAQLVVGRNARGLKEWHIYAACRGAERPEIGQTLVEAVTPDGVFTGPGIVDWLGSPEVARSGELVSEFEIRGAGALLGPA